MTGTMLIAVPLMLLLTVWHTAVGPHFTLWGMEPQLVLLTAVAWGLLRGPEEGAVWAFVGGLFLDLVSVGPFGLNALTLTLTTIPLALVQRTLPTSRIILPPLAGTFGMMLFFALQLLLLSLAGWSLSLSVMRQLPPLALFQGVVMVPVYWLLYLLDQRLNNTAVVSEGL